MKKFTIVELQQNTQEWLEFREGKIGASDISAIMGVSPFETKLQCWHRIVGRERKDKNFAMQRGSELEDKAREFLIKQTGIPYEPKVIQSIDHPELIASLDGFWMSPEGKIYIAEIKCPGKKDQDTAKQGKIPKHYIPQLAQQTNLTGAYSVIYFSWDGESDYGIPIEYEADEDYGEEVMETVLEFAASLIDYNPPEATDRDISVINDPEAFKVARQAFEINQQIKELEKQYKELKAILMARVQDSSSLIQGEDGVGYKFKKVVKQGNVDYKKLMEDYGISDSDKYRKEPIVSWLLSQ